MQDPEALALAFSGEAYDTLATVLEGLSSLVVEITPGEGEPFDAVLIGPDYDANDYAAVKYRDLFGAIGPVKNIIASRIYVY